LVVGVLVELSNKNIDKVFDYNVPKELESNIKIGIRVEVPFGRQVLDGFVLEIKNENTQELTLKDIISIKDIDVVLSSELLELGKWMSKDNLATLISCYQVMLPKALKAKIGSKNLLKMDIFYKINDIDISEYKLSEKQKQIIDLCLEKDLVIKSELTNISLSALKTLVKKEILVEEKKEHYRIQYNSEKQEKKILTNEQQNVVNEIENTCDQVYLLHGVTGSGKTEVYMELIEKQLTLGRSSIVLVPEISLTPQMVSRFQARFGDKIAALHSALSDGEKYDEWRRIARGEASIVIGARSAIFAPLKNIGIIIVDEEHSDSYKQSDSNPRYSAINVAIKRSKYHNCKVVLGSATPSLESYARAKKGVYHLVNLLNRVNGKELPEVKLVDLNEEMKTNKSYFSKVLINSIKECLKNNEQVILLLNRRGYSTIITCSSCGFTYKCPYCEISLTYHKSSNTNRCHYCGYTVFKEETCPKCKEDSLNYYGLGTEKLEDYLNEIFPTAKIVRMDRDSTSNKGSYEKIIQDFSMHKYDIMLGTQMISKGLDFPLVSLVGILNADASLNIPEFKSNEKTFDLLCQASGRAGRKSTTGEVIIQTFNPDNFIIKCVEEASYEKFYLYEMAFRRKLKYPPYYYLIGIKVVGKTYDTALAEAAKVKKYIESHVSEETITLGPTTANILKYNDEYRFQIIIKYRFDDSLKETLKTIEENYATNKSCYIDIDINPTRI